MITIALAPSLAALARFISEQRRRANYRALITDRAADRENQEDNEFIGVLGEIAYGKAMNLYVDLSWEPRSGGHDFMSAGHTIDVKTTRRAAALCVVDKPPEKRSDLYVWVRFDPGDDLHAYIVGFAWAEEVFAPQHEATGIDGRRYYRVPPDALHAFVKR